MQQTLYIIENTPTYNKQNQLNTSKRNQSNGTYL